MSKRKILALALTVAMIAILAVGGSLAYFTDNATKENVFTIGNVSIELTEENWDKTGKAEAEDAYPGEPLAKDPVVTNDGTNPCFVRIKVTGLDQFGADNMITYRTDWTPGKLGDNWVLHTDGYFYYSKVLAKDESTDALFDQIVIPTGIENGAKTTPIVVKAEAIQAQGARAGWDKPETGDGVLQMTVADIAAWFSNYTEPVNP